jgi:hypothetical protein
MLRAKHIAKRKTTPYATGADFCRIFKNDMNRLYLLSLVLTADHSAAHQCFVQGLEDSQKSNPVFKDWAQSWARRMIIANAIRMVQPRPESNTLGRVNHGADAATPNANGAMPEEIASIFALPDFDRFTFVLRILEGYSDRECSLLLRCTVSDLSAARARIFQQMATSADHRGELAKKHFDEHFAQPTPTSAAEAVSHLAASA